MTSDYSRFEEKIHRVDLIDSVMVKWRAVVECDEWFGVNGSTILITIRQMPMLGKMKKH